jgi:hypothetical protein
MLSWISSRTRLQKSTVPYVRIDTATPFSVFPCPHTLKHAMFSACSQGAGGMAVFMGTYGM